MKIVIDTNILFSALLFKNEPYRTLLCSKDYQFYCPNYVFVELFKHKEKILRCAKAPETDVYEYLNHLLEQIRFVNPALISPVHKEKAYELCRDIDADDTVFVALTLELDALLWTGDKILREGLQRKGFTKFFHRAKDS